MERLDYSSILKINETMVEPAHGLHIGQVGRFATQWANRPEVSRMKDVKNEEVSLLYQMIALRGTSARPARTGMTRRECISALNDETRKKFRPLPIS